jgi:hypothetical protein
VKSIAQKKMAKSRTPVTTNGQNIKTGAGQGTTHKKNKV